MKRRADCTQQRGFTLVELAVTVVIIGVTASLAFPAYKKVMQASSSAIAAHTLQQLAIAGNTYLNDHNQTFWKYREIMAGQGIQWWFGFENFNSLRTTEGSRILDESQGPLGPYIAQASGIKADPSFTSMGTAFKPKYNGTYFGYGYNNLLEGKNVLTLQNPGSVVVFATSAQVNTFQSPASSSNPMIEEFYLINDREKTVHFRHGGKALVAFANGSIGALPPDSSTIDKRMPEAKIGRFAPVGDKTYLQ